MITVHDFSTGKLTKVQNLDINENGDIVSKEVIKNEFLNTYPFFRRHRYENGYTILRLIRGFEIVEWECSRVLTQPKNEMVSKANQQEADSWRKIQEIIAKIEHENVENEIIPEIQNLVERFTKNRRTPFSIRVSYDNEEGLDVSLIEDEKSSDKQDIKSVSTSAPTTYTAPVIAQTPIAPIKQTKKINRLSTVISTPNDIPNLRSGGRLIVRFPDGKVFDDPIAVNNYAKVIKYIGSDKVRSLNICRIRRNILVYKDEIPQTLFNKYKPLNNGYYLHINLSNGDKYKILQEISKRLSLNLKIELKPYTKTESQYASEKYEPAVKLSARGESFPYTTNTHKKTSASKQKPIIKKWANDVVAQPKEIADPYNIIRQCAANRLERHYGYQLYTKTPGIYLTNDEKIGYLILYSRAYFLKEEKRRFLFYYRQQAFSKCKEKYVCFICGDAKNILIFSTKEMERYISYVGCSQNPDGKIDHWHIIFHLLPNRHIELVLPYLKDTHLDVTDHLLTDE